MTTTSEKLRSLFLTTLMVLSVFGGTVAFSGTAMAAANNTSVDASSATTVGDTVTVSMDVNQGETVTIEHKVDGDFVNTFQATDGGSLDTNANSGELTVELEAGLSQTGSSEVFVTDSTGTNVSAGTYNVGNYLVEVSPESVIHGESREISGEIYEYPGVLEDDQQVNYALWFKDAGSPSDSVLITDSNTNTGQFTTLGDFSQVDDVQANDYPDDTGTGSEYIVNVGTGDITDDTPGTPSDLDVEGSDNILSRLDVSANPGSASYADSPTFRGNVANASGALNNYQVQFRDPGSDVLRQTSTNSSGDFAFTKTIDDAGNWTLGTADSGANFIGYQTVTVGPEEATVTLSADNGNRPTFAQTYTLNVADAGGNGLDTTSGDAAGYVNITGEFQDGNGDAADGGTDVDGDTIIDYFHVETDADGEVTFDATPASGASSVTATLEHADADSDSAPEGGLENTNDAHNTPASPDYVGSTSLATVAPSPVNIIDEDVEDPVTGYDATDVTNTGPANYQSIFADSGPEVVEVIPLTDAGNRIGADNSRLGYDVNYDLDGMTAYRVQFELTDKTNTPIEPAGTGSNDNFDRMAITGAGINGTIVADGSGNLVANGDAILDARYVDLPDGDANKEYTFLIRPTEVTEANPTIDHEIDVTGESNVSLSLNASGLNVAEFQVNNETADAVQPNSVVDITSVIEDATQGDAPINNGRVRLSQNGTELANFDARTANTNNGEYTFEGVNVGPRGYDTDGDGIGEQISTLDFTAYQYADADDNQALIQREVNKGAVEQLGIALDDTLQIEYDAENTSKYSGTQDGNFTLTRGVEYDQIAFELTEEDGTAVDLTEGQAGVNVNLNDIAYDATGNDPMLVTLTTPNGPAEVRFDTAASDPADGYYVISDIEEVSNIDTSNGAFNDADSFVFGSPSTDAGLESFTLNVETPDRSQTTNASETGTFVTADANVETEVAGVAGDAVPNSVNDTDNNGNMMDELAHNQNAWSQFNTNTSAIEQPTANIDRVYRVNATATDALGTPLNNSDYNDIRVDFDGSIDPTTGATGDNAKFEMVSDGTDVAVQTGDGILGFNDGNSGGTSTNDEVVIQNENGTFQFDIEVESAGDDGIYTPVFEVEAQADTTAAPDGKSDATQGPTVQNPVVEVYSQNGGELPVNEDTGNQILANSLTNQLRVEAFPADEDGFVLPDGIAFSLAGTFAETNVGTSTQSIEDVATSQLATDGYEEGQVGFFQATPTGTGNNFATLQSGGGVVIRDTAGNQIQFDVLTSDRQLNLEVSPAEPTAADDVEITATDDSTFETVGQVSITVESPTGDTTTVLTNANGTATVNASFLDEVGSYSIDTRRAGYADATASFSVGEVPEPNFTLELVDGPTTIVQNESFSATVAVTNEGDGAGTQDVTYNLENSTGNSQLSAVKEDVQLEAGATQEITFNVSAQDTNSLDAGDYTHVFASDDDELTISAEVVEEQSDSGFQPGTPPAEYDSDNDGELSVGELGSAAGDYATGNLSLSELGQVASAYSS